MANWDLNWVPQKTARFGTNWRTVVSQFESGKEQRRKKWSRKKHRFILSFEALTDTITDEIRVFFDSLYGAYTAFYFPNFMQMIKGTRLSTVDGGAGTDYIIDSQSGWIKKGFNTDLYVRIGGSVAGCNSTYTISAINAASLFVPAGSFAATEGGNADLAAYCTYRTRFKDDYFENNFLYKDVGEVRRVELIEDI